MPKQKIEYKGEIYKFIMNYGFGGMYGCGDRRVLTDKKGKPELYFEHGRVEIISTS